MFPTDVSKRYNCTQGLIVKCVKSWTPIGETPREIDKLSISKNWSKGVLDYYEAQHLYITSDEEIKEGDWRVLSFKNWDEVIETIITNTQFVGGNYCTVSEQKIIATTDASLISINEQYFDVNKSRKSAVLEQKTLPKIPQQFIEKWIEEYNKGNVITEVMVEYNKKGIIQRGRGGERTITIRKIKESWNREEVIELLHKSLNANIVFNDKFNKIFHEQLDEWIKENL